MFISPYNIANYIQWREIQFFLFFFLEKGSQNAIFIWDKITKCVQTV